MDEPSLNSDEESMSPMKNDSSSSEALSSSCGGKGLTFLGVPIVWLDDLIRLGLQRARFYCKIIIMREISAMSAQMGH